MNRLLINYQRVTARDALGNPVSWVGEFMNIVHPDDAGQKRENFNTFRELGAMFKGNSDYINVKYTKLEAVI